MKCRLVSISEIQKDNPRKCLSPLRYLGKCHHCWYYKTCKSKIVTEQAQEYHKIEEEIKHLKTALDRAKEKLKRC